MYSSLVRRKLSKAKIEVGDRIAVVREGERIEGILMPSHEFSNENCIVLKLDSGYNLGIELDKRTKLIKLASARRKRGKKKLPQVQDPNKPTIAILHTGGTIASRVDYETGAVVASFSPEDLLEMYPELGKLANLKSRLLMNVFSENLRFEHYTLIAREVAREIEKGVDGVIVTHGTDTLHYTAAALAFALEDVGVPVILVGAQRSSDRGSSDAFLNLYSAVRFCCETDFAGVAICMHAGMGDDACHILPPCRSRKLHSSRRDAFKAVDDVPIAKVGEEIEFYKDYRKKERGKVKLYPKFEPKVGLLKLHPNISSKLIEFFGSYKGLVLEGTGLGHAPIEHGNEASFEALKRIAKRCIVAMTTQCIYGPVNMNVYSTGRKLQAIGVIPCNMLAEVALVKLAWLLGNFGKRKAKELLNVNLRGEIVTRRL